MPFLALALDNADRLFALMITPGYVHHVEMADEDPASGSLSANLPNGDSRSKTVGCSLMSILRKTNLIVSILS